MKINNSFTERWIQFKSKLSEESLREEFKPKPFIERAKGLYYAALSATYVANTISAASALALAMYVLTLIIPWLWASTTIAVAIVLSIEWFKRSVAEQLWHGALVEGTKPIGYAVAALLLFGISASGSVIGANWAIRKIAEQGIEEVSYTPQITAIEKDLAQLDATIAEMRKQRTSKGELPYRAQKAINQALDQQRTLRKQRSDLMERERIENSALYVKSMKDIDNRAYAAIWIVLFFEFLFQVCFRFLKLFRFRSAVELGFVDVSGSASAKTSARSTASFGSNSAQTQKPKTNPFAQMYGKTTPAQKIGFELPKAEVEKQIENKPKEIPPATQITTQQDAGKFDDKLSDEFVSKVLDLRGAGAGFSAPGEVRDAFSEIFQREILRGYANELAAYNAARNPWNAVPNKKGTRAKQLNYLRAEARRRVAYNRFGVGINMSYTEGGKPTTSMVRPPEINNNEYKHLRP